MALFTNKNAIETIVGGLVLIGAILLFREAYRQGDTSKSSGYKLVASFQSVEGLVQGSDVMIGGIKVGLVSKLAIDPKTFQAKAELTLNDEIKLPADSSAMIASSGLIGGKYLSISPGGAEEVLKNGDRIEYTQSSVNFETLLGKYIFNKDTSTDDKKKGDGKK
jgi:phospholipid/cholesterol/gamma-HCH transport system substrate-binding protein